LIVEALAALVTDADLREVLPVVDDTRCFPSRMARVASPVLRFGA
jgi:hypothetical protein